MEESKELDKEYYIIAIGVHNKTIKVHVTIEGKPE